MLVLLVPRRSRDHLSRGSNLKLFSFAHVCRYLLDDSGVLAALATRPKVSTVQNGTVELLSRCHRGDMLYRKAKTEPGNPTRASVRRIIATLRMAKSGRKAEMNLDAARIFEPPRVTMHGTVAKIIPSPRPSQPGRAQIAVDGADRGYRDLRIENTFTEENGDDVRLKQAEIPARYAATNSAERSRYLKLDGFRLLSCANPGNASD